MARKYRLDRRLERQAQTRRRIVEAAIDLHAKRGPARTTVTAIAERAGVQRHTYYRHFPDERSLSLACSGLHLERHPPPDPDRWRDIADPVRRARRGLEELYRFYEANESMLGNVLRDAEVDPLTRETAALRFGPVLAAMRDVLADGLAGGRHRAKVLAAVELALDFHTWRSLVRHSGLTGRQAADLMAGTLACLRG